MPAAQSEIEHLVKTAQASRLAGDRAAALARFQAAQAIDPNNVQLRLDIATELRALKRYAEAAETYHTIRLKRPDNLAAIIGLAQLKNEQRDREGALELFREAHQLNQEHLGVRLEIGRLLRELGRLDEAEEIFSRILEHAPHEIGAIIGSAAVYRLRGNREKSLAILTSVSERSQNNTKLRLEIASDLRHLDRLTEARELLDRTVADNPESFDARMALGHVTRQQGDRLGALAQFRQAAALDGKHPAPKLHAAQDLRELGRLEEAEISLNEVLALDPDNFDAHAALGLVRRLQGNRPASIAQFLKAASLNPGHAGVKLQAAQGLRELGRLDEAEAVVNEVVAAHPAHFEGHVALGHIARQRGTQDLALQYFQRAAVLNPTAVGPQLQSAHVLRDLGRFDEAETILNQVLQIEPGNLEARIAIAQVRRGRGDRQGSLAELQSAANLNPKHIGIRLEIAADLRELGRVAEAMTVIGDALAIDPNHANANAQLGYLHRIKGQYQMARDLLAKAAASDPNSLTFRIELANCHREIGQAGLAEAELSKVNAEYPDNVQAAVALATLLIEAFRLDEAKAVLERQKPSVPILLALGRLARRADRRSDALDFFQRAHELEPENVGPLFELLQEHRAQGHLAQALAMSERLLARGPSMQALLDRGRIHRDRGERELAVATFKSASTQFPEAWQPKLELAIEYRFLGDPQQTQSILKSILDENGDNLQALDQLIEYLRMAEQFEEALELCRRVMSLRPGIHWPYVRAAHIAAKTGQIELTWKFLDDAENLAGLHPEITATRIELLRFLRKLREAEAFASGLPPERASHFAVGIQTVQNAVALGELDLARTRLDNLRPQAAQSRSAIQRLRGRILELGWDHEGAIAQYELSLEDDPHNPGTYHELAKCNLLLFRPAVASKHLRKSLELGKSANILRGGSHNSSQSHMGQLIDEFLIDSELLAELVSLDQQDRDARLPRLMELVAENPDNTTSAIALLLELRKSGRLSVRPSRGKLAIPKSIVQFWDDPEVPAELAELCASWVKFNPDFSYAIFNERSARDFLNKHHSPAVLAAFEASREPAQKADLFRLAYLAICGGFYADCDDRCATSLEEFIPDHAEFVAYHEEFGTLGNNFIGATAAHPVIRRALDLAVEAILRNDNDMIWLLTGPGLLTRAYAIAAAEELDELLSRSAIFTVGEIQRYLENHCPVTYKLTARHWLKSAFAARRRKST